MLRNVSFELCFFVVDAWAHSMRIASQAIQYTVKLIGEEPAEKLDITTSDFSALDKAMEVLDASINKDSGAP